MAGKKKDSSSKPKSKQAGASHPKAASAGKKAAASQGAPSAMTAAVATDVGKKQPKLKFDTVGNFFDSDRAGAAVVRPDDLLALRVERRNLDVVPASPPRLVKSGRGAAHLILHFPPQAITERTFFETRPEGTTNTKSQNTDEKQDTDEPTSNPKLPAPPVRARIAGESRLVFQVPDGFDIPYRLADVLEACRTLALGVAANALPPSAPSPAFYIGDQFDSAAVEDLTPQQRAALTSFAVRSLQIGAVMRDEATVRLREFGSGPAIKVRARPSERRTGIVFKRAPPHPAAPPQTATAIEFPWRLILSPHADERWHHANEPVTSKSTGHTELWHSRLVAPDAEGVVVEPPHPDPRRTVRAIWALTGEASKKTMKSDWPGPADLPDPHNKPFLMPLNDYDRVQLAHLTSNFQPTNYTPQPVGTNLLMLSALGGWLDSRGAWNAPGLPLEEWVHRASMARDHYVRVVYRGFLFPFGHRVSLVKVSERKFHNGARDEDGKPTIEQMSGNTAYLRQRLFIVVRERERRFDEPGFDQLRNSAGDVFYSRQFPFSSVRILTQVTPNLDPPDKAPSKILGQQMFWPHVDGKPFKFEFVATDLDGHRIAFELPMIFMDAAVASPHDLNPLTKKLDPKFPLAESYALFASAVHAGAAVEMRRADLKGQRVALAPSLKPGDTSVAVDSMEFGAETEALTLRTYSDDLARPVFFPKVVETRARIGALAHLTGSEKSNALTWNSHYLQHGFASNVGQVFANVKKESSMATLDFSAQGDRSGGFVQPNLMPNALSRFAGPVMGDVGKFIDGIVPDGGGFPAAPSDLPLPLLFGCIPLNELVKEASDFVGTPQRIPKFVSEAATQVESFVNGLARLYGFIVDVASQPASIADAAMTAFKSTLTDLKSQANCLTAAQASLVQGAVGDPEIELGKVVTSVQALAQSTIDGAPSLPQLGQLPGSIADARAAAAQLIANANSNVAGALPSGLKQSILSAAQRVDAFLSDLQAIPTLVAQGKTLFDALDAIVGQPDQLGALLSDAGTLKTRVEAVQNAIGPLKTTLNGFDLVDGAPRKTLVDAMAVVEQALGGVADLTHLIEQLTGEELTIRFDWNPEIGNWSLKSGDPPLFRANDKHGFLVSVEAKVKKTGGSKPKISVNCSLKHFDLVLIAPASFLELSFEKIEFSVDSGAKTDVDVLLSDVKFVGPLSFVETLKDLIPLDGFSDPPHLDITTKGIDAGYSVTLPAISVGVMNLSNLSLGAGFTVPFIGQPLSVRFNFCTREQPFCLTVWMFGGGGSFGVTLDPQGVQILEASFEFGASVSIDFGVAYGPDGHYSTEVPAIGAPADGTPPSAGEAVMRALPPDWKDPQLQGDDAAIMDLFETAAEYDFYRAMRFYRREPPTEEQRKMRWPTYTGVPEAPKPPEYDFHRIVASLAEYPALLRELGLVIDFAVKDDGLIDSLIAAGGGTAHGQMSLRIKWGKRVAATKHNTPRTAWTADKDRFVTRPRRPDHQRGLLRLEHSDDTWGTKPKDLPGLFDVYQVDPDGAALKTVGFTLSAQNLVAKSLSLRQLDGEVTYTTGDDQPVTSIRSGGLGVSQHGRASRVAQDAAAAALKNQAVEVGNGNHVVFFAEDLLRGYRVDVAPVPDEQSPGKWHTLCAREGVYRLTATDEPIAMPSDEGYVSGASTTSPTRGGRRVPPTAAVARPVSSGP